MTANRRIFHSGGMKSLFMKLYSASIASILLAMYATFYLLWYQWQPENNYNLHYGGVYVGALRDDNSSTLISFVFHDLLSSSQYTESISCGLSMFLLELVIFEILFETVKLHV